MKIGKLEFHPVVDIEDFWKFWSVRIGLLAGACCVGMAAYATARNFDPVFVAHFPTWIIDALSYGSVIFGVAAFIARGIDQPNLNKTRVQNPDAS